MSDLMTSPSTAGYAARCPLPAPVELRLLGAVDVAGVVPRAKHAPVQQVELVALLALHPGVTAVEIAEALWPERRVSVETVTQRVSQARVWLGRAADGSLRVARADTFGRYRLHADVGTDWHRFRALVELGDPGAALQLVRAQPFAGTSPAAYAWAGLDCAEMIATIHDTAHQLAGARWGAGDITGARVVIAQGLRVEPSSRVLRRMAIELEMGAGNPNAAARQGLHHTRLTGEDASDLIPATFTARSRLCRTP